MTLTSIVFDLDDTLYPEREYVRSGFRAVAAWAALRMDVSAEDVFEDLWRLFSAGVRGDTFDRWLHARGRPTRPWVERMVSVYRDHEPCLALDARVVALLERLRRRYRLGLLTDGHAAIQRKKVAALGVAGWFEAMVFTDDDGREAWKPSPKPFQTIVDRMRIAGAQAVYVADNPLKDFLGARQVGMGTVRVRRADGLYSHLEPPSPAHAPAVEIATLESLEASLARHHPKQTIDGWSSSCATRERRA